MKLKGEELLKLLRNLKALLAVLFLLGVAFSADEAGEVVEKQGRVRLYKDGSPLGKLIEKLPEPLYVKDILKTDYSSMAFVKLLGVDKLVLMEDSVLYIEGIDKVGLEGGRAVFQIRKRDESQGLKVKVRSVIIGVKGTKFFVSVEGDKIGVYLREGLLSVRNEVGEFIRYRKREEEEFERLKKEAEEGMRKEKEGFERWKRETEAEFKEFVKEFELRPGKAVMIVGNEVRDIEIPPDVEERFKLLDMF